MGPGDGGGQSGWGRDGNSQGRNPFLTTATRPERLSWNLNPNKETIKRKDVRQIQAHGAET